MVGGTELQSASLTAMFQENDALRFSAHPTWTAIAKRKNRSITQPVLHYIEKGLVGDELSQEQQIVVEEMKREMIKKMFR